MDRSVAESWILISGWLEERIPGALEHLQPPASADSVAAVRAAMGCELPDDLLAWLRIADGFGQRGSFGYLLPYLFNPLPCADMLREREMWRSVYADSERPEQTEPAGAWSTNWLDQFLPIGDAGTDISLYVDLRKGELFGSVGEFDSESGTDLTQWMSVAGMFADVADALTLEQPALLDLANRRRTSQPWSTTAAWTPYLDEGRLRWNSLNLDDQT
ncbi:SMI1/KNR4 family protein [Kribbella sp. NPDC051952]|uniref:SMI1/KNR4 family protein n=1 Tax=Kribbella sp. NPDC051952 TaxID=3154851 RepID=UPI00342A5313